MTELKSLTRRDALKGIAASLAALGLAGRAQEGRRIPVALQLYSVRDLCAKDFDGTLAEVARLGFRGVEFGGFYNYGKDAAGLRKKLDDLGLKAAGKHVRADLLQGDELKKTLDFLRTLGVPYLIVSSDRRFSHPEGSKEYAEFINLAADALKQEGFRLGHHNHTDEFKKAGERTYWDLFAERTHPDVVLQLDVGHATYAGVDPVSLVRKYPGRTRSTHVKARLPDLVKGRKPLIGQDVTDWPAYVTACYQVGGTEWFTLEQEEYPDGMTSMEASRLSFVGFRKVLTDLGKS